jgi:hypothetical protein
VLLNRRSSLDAPPLTVAILDAERDPIGVYGGYRSTSTTSG